MSALLRFSARGFSDISPLVRRAPARFFPRLGLKYSTAHSRATEVARQENWRRRVDLAAAYRGLEKYSFNEGVWNHLSMLAPAADGSGEVMLITPYGLHWSEVKASSLIGLNDKRETVEGQGEAEISASTIHLGVHKARSDAVCVFHLHAPYSTALSLQKNPRLGMYHQVSCAFYDSVAYDRDFSGLSDDEEEGQRTARQLGDKKVLFMCNHGVVVVGPTVAATFDRVYYLERACMYQILAKSAGEELHEIDDDTSLKTREQTKTYEEGPFGSAHFESVKRILKNQDPGFME